MTFWNKIDPYTTLLKGAEGYSSRFPQISFLVTSDRVTTIAESEDWGRDIIFIVFHVVFSIDVF